TISGDCCDGRNIAFPPMSGNVRKSRKSRSAADTSEKHGVHCSWRYCLTTRS
ncbi:uncharacterized protein PHACADRAFT_266506, partial [Phanerochaete carnosa HHB-10118-sp]